MDSAASSGRWARLHMFTMQVEPRDLDDAKSEQRELPTVESVLSLDDAQSLSNSPWAAVQVSNGWINSVPCCFDLVHPYMDFSFQRLS